MAKEERLIQVSNVKKPLFFYVNLAKRLLSQGDTLKFNAVGLAISTLVTIVEILKHENLVEVKNIQTSTIAAQAEHAGSFKAQMDIVVMRTPDFFQNTSYSADE